MGFYQEMITKMKPEERHNWRYKIVRFAREHGIKVAAREFKTYPKVVRCWVRRFEKEGLTGLNDRSKAPKTSPNRCPEAFETEVIRLRKKTKNSFGALRLKERFDLKFGKSCIQRIIRQKGLKRLKKTKRLKRNELWSTKKLTRVFEKIQVDVKELTDIPLYWSSYNENKLPKFEFTARCVKTGATFVCYAKRNTNLNSAIFMVYLLRHLQAHNFDLTQVEIQTDNGSEFNVAGRKKKGLMPFEFVVKEIFSVKLGHIPPASPTFNSDVETFHRLVEDEFYAIEPISSLQNLKNKAYTYLIEFNYLRTNSYKDGLSPIQLAKAENPNFNIQLFNLPPILLDDHTNLYFMLTQSENDSLSVLDSYTLRTGKPDPFQSEEWLTFSRSAFQREGGYYVPSLHKP